ncbi:MAG: hypothetical protein L0Y79_02130 [Chlorobi bacterium]|nr:hypothetical protein [Chlorobiota bacterium]MCI0716579.1 hypothetical protein [Chlorobiota bacterium]
MKQKPGFLIFCFLVTLSGAAFGITAPPNKVGTLSVKINGVQYTGDLFAELNPYSYEVSAGDKNYEVKLAWNYISGPSEIKTGIFDFYGSSPGVVLRYVNFNSFAKFVTKAGFLNVRYNEGGRVYGEFGFVASESGTASKYADEKYFTDGTFEINYGK